MNNPQAVVDIEFGPGLTGDQLKGVIKRQSSGFSIEDLPGKFIELNGLIADADLVRQDMCLGQQNEMCLPKFTLSEEKALAFFTYIYGSSSKAKDAAMAYKMRAGLKPVSAQAPKKLEYVVILLVQLREKIWIKDQFFYADKESSTSPDSIAVLASHPLTAAIACADKIAAVEIESNSNRITNNSPVELARFVEEQWPFMRRIHLAGGFYYPACELLLYVSSYRDRLLSKEPLTNVERYSLLVAMQGVISTLPHRLYLLAGVYLPELNKALEFEYKFAGVTCRDLKPGFDVWDVVPEELPLTIDSISIHRMTNSGGLPVAFSDVALKLLSASSICQDINSKIGDLVVHKLRPIHEQICQFFDLANASDVKTIRPPEFNQDLKVDIQVQSIAGLNALLNLACKFSSVVDSVRGENNVLDESEKRMASIREVQDEIHQLSASRSIDSLLEIASLAAKATTLIVENQDWYQSRLAEFQSYFERAVSILDEIKSLDERAVPAPVAQTVSSPAPEVEPVLAAVCAAPSIEPVGDSEGRIAALEASLKTSDDLLTTALADLDHISVELKEKKEELHRLRSCTPASIQGGLTAKVPAPEFDAVLLSRVALRTNLTATDVLDFFAMIAPDRVVVLKSAYDTAADNSGSPASIERMLDLINKAVFPYLDAITSGTPDSEARKLFGTKAYSAKESTQTINNGRMSALRDFAHEGKTVRFERHLRINNGTGKDGMRVYFEIIDGKVVIAYAGPHLDVSNS